MSSVPPRRIPHAAARPRSTTTSPNRRLDISRPATIAYPRRPGPTTSTEPLELKCSPADKSTFVTSWRRENAAMSGSDSIRWATRSVGSELKRTMMSGSWAARAARSKPWPSPSETTIAADSIAAASAIPSAVSSDRRRRTRTP